MGRVYVISDLHFGHENMAKWRGFESAEHQDNHIIKMWNNTVDKGDTIWILGDISMEKSEPYAKLDELKGYKKVVLGNHDAPKDVKKLLKHVNMAVGVFKYKNFWLTHFPIHPIELMGMRNIHGHVHGKSLVDDRYINVSCEAVKYTPIEILKI